MSNSDIQRAMDDIVDSCFDLRGRIMDAEAAAEAAKQVDDKPPAKVSSDPALENVFKAVKSGVGAASENKDTIATVLDTLVKHVDPSISVPSAGEIGSALNKASTLVEFAQLIAKTSDAGSKGVKAATRFLAANGLEIASTIVNVAKVAADFVPVPGLGIAIGIIDKILKNIGDSRDAPKIMQAFCDALGEIKAIIAPMANQWFSADVQSKCSDLVALLKEANAAVERAKADAKTWRALLGGASTKMAAQVESLRKKLGKIKELLSLAMQVDSAMMLMRMAEQLNIIDVKADKMLALLRPRTLLLRHDDFMIAPKPLDSSGSFRVFEAKMDGSPFVIKEFHDGIEGREDDLEAEAHRWFNANHPNLLQLTGICLAKDKQTVRGPFIALPFVEYDLESLVKDHPDLSQDNKLRILLRIARGLKYLHEQAPDAPIVHGSLTMRHVRVEIKERMVDDVREIQVTKVLIVPAVGIGKPSKTDSNADAFAAPEASKAGSKPDAKHDIFSFGVMALSIVLGKEPAQVRTSYLDNPEGFDRQLFDLFIQAKMQIPNIRPNLDQFISRLNNKLKMEPELARPGASDIELLCAAFPDWTRDSGITLSSNNPHGDLVFIFDTTTQRSTVKWRLDWDAEHNLTALRLTASGISGGIPEDLGRLTELRTLWLDQNELHGEIPAKLFGLRNLTSLRIGQNKLRGPISTRISKLTQLVELDISGCGLDEIPDALASLKQLKILNLSGNNIKELPEQIGEMQLLEILNLSDCKIEKLPIAITSMQSLRILNLSHTKQLNGDSGISDLPADIGRLANLTELNLDGNRINELPESIGDLAHLEKLTIPHNRLKVLPDSLCKLVQLADLDLQHNQLESLPAGFGKLAHLKDLNLSSNQLSALPQSFIDLMQLTKLDLSGNQLGELPDQIGRLNRLKQLSLAYCRLQGLPESLGGMVHLKMLDLAGNSIESLPESFGSICKLENLVLDENQLTELPKSFGRLRQLKFLSLFDNRRTSIPDSFIELKSLVRLHLGSNGLQSLPEAFGRLKSIQELYLSSNQLSSLPPSTAQLERLKQLDLNSNLLVQLPEGISNLRMLEHLLVSSNLLVDLPDDLGEMQQLRTLNLSYNKIATRPACLDRLSNTVIYHDGNPYSA